jgi:hypothetical protein
MAQPWQAKLNAKKQPKLQILAKPMAGIPAGGTLFMPTPQLVKQFMDAISPGQSMTLGQMRQQLAQAHEADGSCPLATSMAARIVAEAAWEEIAAGQGSKQVTPFWRMIEPGSSIAKKLACGSEFIETMRQQEGIESP